MNAARGRQRWWRGLLGALAFVACVSLFGGPRAAHADTNEADPDRVALAKGSYKVRLAAALRLSRTLTDANVDALISALLRDREVTIRRVAVAAVAKACQAPSLAADVQTEACRALKAAQADADDKVRKTARAATPAKGAAGTGLYVYIPLTKRTTEHAQLVAAIGASLAETSSHFSVDWASTSPQQADAARQDRRAYRVDVAVARIDVKRAPRGGISLQCSVSLAVAPWHGAGKQERWTAADTARISGSARVESSGSRAQATSDCVKALGRDMAQKRLAAFLRANAPVVGKQPQVAHR